MNGNNIWIEPDSQSEMKSKANEPLNGATCCAPSVIEGLLADMEERGKIGEILEDEYFKNRQPKGYQHLPRLVDDLQEMSSLLPTQIRGQNHQDKRSLLQGLLQH